MVGVKMGFSTPDRLTPLQRSLLSSFFAREQRFFLTGGAALAGFYFGHRETEDLDLFTSPGVGLDDAEHALTEAATELGAAVSPLRRYADFRRFLVVCGAEECVVDLVVDRAPTIDVHKVQRGQIRVDTLREIAANKVCTLLSRSEIKDLVDLRALLESGVDLAQALADAEQKDAGVDPATLAWVLDQVSIHPEARMPYGEEPEPLDAFRRSLVVRLRGMALERVRRS